MMIGFHAISCGNLIIIIKTAHVKLMSGGEESLSPELREELNGRMPVGNELLLSRTWMPSCLLAGRWTRFAVGRPSSIDQSSRWPALLLL